MKNNTLLNIIKNNKNNNYKIMPLNIKLSDYRSKYEAPVSKEWKNTVFSYYKNSIKNITVNHLEINKIIISYFNLYFLPKFLYFKNMSKTRRASLLRRIYVSNVEIKQTNNKAIITLYIINTERKRMISRYFKLEVLKKIIIFFNQLTKFLTKEIYISNNNKINIKIWEKYKLFLKNIGRGYGHQSVQKLIFNLSKIKYNLKIRPLIPFFNKINDYKFTIFVWFYFFEIKNIFFLELLYNLKFKYFINKSYQEIKLKNKLKELKKKFEEWKIFILYLEKFYVKSKFLKTKDQNTQILNINIFKIHYGIHKKYTYPYKLFIKKLDRTYSYLYKLNTFIMRILNKKIEFNIVSLKSFVYNSDIFTRLLSLKLRKRKYFSVFKGMHGIINNVRLPNINTIIERRILKKNKDYLLVDNKYKNNNLSSNKDLFNNFYKNIQKNNILKSKGIIFEQLLNSVKYKNIGGLKLEVKGRLTRRYRADKALYKLNWIGGLKNIESSYNKLSSILYRGYSKPNVSYSIFNSKRRVGAFAAKGWVSGK